MNDESIQIEQIQKDFCLEYRAAYFESPRSSVSGFALSTKGRAPLNGLRHPPQGNANGWYLWFGEEHSDDPEFYQPVHIRHIYEELPSVTKLLGLPPGYRFLLAGDYLDVWYDSSLLNV